MGLSNGSPIASMLSLLDMAQTTSGTFDRTTDSFEAISNKIDGISGGGTKVIFRYHKAGVNQTGFNAGVSNKVTWSTAEIDTGNAFDDANDRFQPSVAGYYYVHTAGRISSLADTGQFLMTIKKNGTVIAEGQGIASYSSYEVSTETSTTVYMNGTTDYLDVWALENTTANTSLLGLSYRTYFDGFLVE